MQSSSMYGGLYDTLVQHVAWSSLVLAINSAAVQQLSSICWAEAISAAARASCEHQRCAAAVETHVGGGQLRKLEVGYCVSAAEGSENDYST
jgi:hypothetical protein